jgi:isoquinoline 1-oxidoreductase subunit beta
MSALLAPRLSRRSFMASGAAAGAVLVLGASASKADVVDATTLHRWLRIDSRGGITLLSNTSEIGQGTGTGLAVLVAEELDVDPQRIELAMAPVDKQFFNPMTNSYAVFGSRGLRGQFDTMRKVGAAARIMLVEAAAARWGVDPSTCRTADGQVHNRTGGTFSYAELVADAARRQPPADPPLKPESDWKVIGKPTRRLDLPAKVDGSAVYGIDASRPGLLIATIKQCPVRGGRLKDVDPAPALALEGVRNVVRLEDAVAVVATGYWAAKKGAEALSPEWNLEGTLRKSSDTLLAELQKASVSEGKIFTRPGVDKDAEVRAANAAFAGAARVHMASYHVPFLAHATLEPMNATAEVSAGRAELWLPTQTQTATKNALARALSIAPENVTINTLLSGGGYGRRLEYDFAIQAALIAREVAAPVKLIWSREEDMTQGFYRPAVAATLAAALDANGRPLAFTCRTAGPSPLADSRPGTFQAPAFDATYAAGVVNSPYALGQKLLSWAKVLVGARSGFWRSVGDSQNVFFVENFIDELAQLAGEDPLEYRRALLADRPRELAVLDAAARAAEWDRPLPAGQGRGIALVAMSNTVSAQVVEAAVHDDGRVEVKRIVCALDCGTVVNPDAVRAQAEGGIIWGLGAAFNAITLKDGVVEQTSFDSYALPMLAQMPEIEIHLVSSSGVVGGAGEETVPPVAPALANAIFAATGKRITQLPLTASGYSLG